MVKSKKDYMSRKYGKIDSRSKHDRHGKKFCSLSTQEEIDICLNCEEATCPKGKCEKIQKRHRIYG